MTKHRKKLACICRGKTDRTLPGVDRQKHIPSCPIALKNRKFY